MEKEQPKKQQYDDEFTYDIILRKKTIDFHEMILQMFPFEHEIIKTFISLIILNPVKTYKMVVEFLEKGKNLTNYIYDKVAAIITFKKPPVLKTFEINYFVESAINNLYTAFDWYLKTASKRTKIENHLVMIMTKQIDKSKIDKDYPIMSTVPENNVTEFEYENLTFKYSKSSFDDYVYSAAGEMKKKNYKITIWCYDCGEELFRSLCQHVANSFAKSKNDDVWIQQAFYHQNGTWKGTPLERNRRKIDTVIMSDYADKDLEKRLKHFYDTENWHIERGINYKKSYLFYGPPGTGKSSMIKAISYHAKRHIHNFNLAMIQDDNEFTKLVSNIVFTETIIVFEDIDAQSSAVFERTNNENKNNDEKKEKPGVTLASLLNFIDGIGNAHGRILIITTNQPDVLDKALTRPGRIDEKIFFGYCGYKEIKRMFDNFYQIDIEESQISEYVDINARQIAPCNVENSMRLFPEDYLQALEQLAKGDELKEFTY